MKGFRNTLQGIVLLPLLLFPGAGSAQLASASAAAMGTGGNYSALARGFGSIGLNPAGLGMPGTPDFSLALLPVAATQTLNPITLSDLADVSGSLIPSQTKEAWMEKIAASGRETGGTGADVTWISLNAGPVGIQASTLVRARADLNDAASELVLFGNAGRTGLAENFHLDGSEMDGLAVSTVGLGFGLPVMEGGAPGSPETLALGATLKYSVGHALVLAQDQGSELRSEPLEVAISFPMVQSDTADFDRDHGAGVGLDVGLAWERGPWALALAVLNVFHTFEWDVDGMFYRSGEAFFDGVTSDSDFEAVEGSNAPQELRDAVGVLGFEPQLSLGAAYEAAEDLTLTTEFRKRFGEGIEIGPELHLGVGLEYLALDFLPLRLGAAKVSDGFQFGGGFSLVLGPVNISWAGALQRGDAEGALAGVSLSFGSY